MMMLAVELYSHPNITAVSFEMSLPTEVRTISTHIENIRKRDNQNNSNTQKKKTKTNFIIFCSEYSFLSLKLLRFVFLIHSFLFYLNITFAIRFLFVTF